MAEKKKTIFHDILELSKVKITIAVTITTVTGYILYHRGISWDILLPSIGLFFLACGSAVINHLQEMKKDALMKRTRNRPLPSGRVKSSLALVLVFIYLLSGSALLYFFGNLTALVLGWTALVWYNLVYTILKRYTAFAVIPGSVIGSIPPMVGWVVAGGEILDTRLILLAIFFFVWQIPHFFLLAIKFNDDYTTAGYPGIKESMPEKLSRVMIFLFFLLTALTAILLPLGGVVISKVATWGFMVASAGFVLINIPILYQSFERKSSISYFRTINYYVLLVVMFMCLDVVI